jgi:xanthine/CO dehydrogenase XdhC/CoxF family maturation factor
LSRVRGQGQGIGIVSGLGLGLDALASFRSMSASGTELLVSEPLDTSLQRPWDREEVAIHCQGAAAVLPRLAAMALPNGAVACRGR